MNKNEDEPHANSPLRKLKFRGNVLLWSILGTLGSLLGLFLLTGFSPSPWLFLLYPALIFALLISLGMLALHLIYRF